LKKLYETYDPLKLEKKIFSWWKENKIFEKTVERRRGGPIFRFLEGPPTANGYMHVGHARGRTIKDIILRFKTMQGYDVWRKAGWDCQGLPVEVEVEEKLGVKSKKEIYEKIGCEKFVKECNKLVDYYISHWREASERLGLWLDYDAAYETRRNEYIEHVWHTLKIAYEKGLLVQDFKVLPYCPRCQTPLSGHEAGSNYDEVEDPSIYVKFKVRGHENLFIVIWTTTPWTLPGNEAVCVHPDYRYAYVKVGNETWIMARDLVEKAMEEIGVENYEIIKEVYGEDLEGMKYDHPLKDEVPWHKEHDEGFLHSVICGMHVTLEEGTGCVHTAPGHGPEDFEVGREYGLPIFCPVNEEGRFTVEAGKYKGMYIKDADSVIIEDLRKKGLLLYSGKIKHAYPLCWRCDTPLMYIADKNQWFLRVEPLRKTMLSENEKVYWKPAWAGHGRFRNWLESSKDWCISRSRIWGSPLNVWICEKCGNMEVIGSIKELKEKAISLPEKLDLHIPYIDKVKIRCSKCGGEAKRVPYVLDCWLDSGVAHTASIDALRNPELFEKLFPYDFITEAVDQTRGWFYTLLFTSVLLYGKTPFKSVLNQGLVLDEHGVKMSKSRGNVIWAMDAMNKLGADTLRLYLMEKASAWDALCFDFKEAMSVTQKKLRILWNIFLFATTYMTLDKYDPLKHKLSDYLENLQIIDKWILSRLNTCIKEVTELLESLEVNKAAKTLFNFIVEDVSHTYLRFIRRRVWIEEETLDKTVCYTVLYNVLSNVLKMVAVFTPYIAEEIYQHFMRDEEGLESIHMCDWPNVNESLIDKQLEEDMEIMLETLSATIDARKRKGFKLRWPTLETIIVPFNERTLSAMKRLEQLYAKAANTRKVSLMNVGEYPDFAKFKIEPNYGSIGPKYKEKVPLILKALNKMDAREVITKLYKEGKLEIEIATKEKIELMREDINVSQELPEEYGYSESKYGIVYVNCKVTDEIMAEALTNDIIRRIQAMRKDLKLDIEQFVKRVTIVTPEKKYVKLLSKHAEYMKTEVRAETIEIVHKDIYVSVKDKMKHTYEKEWKINEEAFIIGILV